MHSEHLAGGRLDFAALLAGIHQREGRLGIVAEDNGHIVDLNGRGHVRSLLFRIRSSMIATTTMTMPDSKPSAVLT